MPSTFISSAPGARRLRPARAAIVLLLAAAPLVAGCLGKPKIEDRWTRLDLEASNVTPDQALPPGTAESLTVRTAITYRSIITGVAVAELRASGTVSAADVGLGPDAPRVRMASDIDRILANSVSVGRATRAITGWDHLIQTLDFQFTVAAPAAGDTTVGSGGAVGLFLVCYLGAGDRVERADGSDTLIVTPFLSTDYEILPVGIELSAPAPMARRQ